MDFRDYLYYDETSPSCLRWKVQRGKYKKGDVAGSLGSDGYWQIWLTVDGVRYRPKNHRVVQQWFYGVPYDYPIKIDHKDRVKTNNAYKNLRIASDQLNQRNQVRKQERTLVGVENLGNGVFRARARGGSRYIGRYTSQAAQAAQYDQKVFQLGAPIEQRNLPCMLLELGELCESPVFLL